jgi:hypothetical protein
MNEYFATCHVQGPISVRVLAEAPEEVLEQIKTKGQRWIDISRSDVEDIFLDPEFEDDWSDYSLEDIQETMEELGFHKVHDSSFRGYWIIWSK